MISSHAVGATETTVLPRPSSRPYKFVAISNNGDNVAYLKIVGGGDPVSSSNGIALAAGSAVLFDQDRYAELLHSGATAVSPSGTIIAVQAG